MYNTGNNNSFFSDDDSNHLWGDGAAAVLLMERGEFRVLATMSRGRADLGRATEAVRMRPRDGGLQMPHGREVFQNACDEMEQISREILDKLGLEVGDLALVVPHQANLRILQVLAERMKIPSDRIAVSIDLLGNTGSASVPITLHRNIHRIPPGGKALLVSFGGGYSVGAAVLERV